MTRAQQNINWEPESGGRQHQSCPTSAGEHARTFEHSLETSDVWGLESGVLTKRPLRIYVTLFLIMYFFISALQRLTQEKLPHILKPTYLHCEFLNQGYTGRPSISLSPSVGGPFVYVVLLLLNE